MENTNDKYLEQLAQVQQRSYQKRKLHLEKLNQKYV